MSKEFFERLPYETADIPEIERWLDQMALKGNFLSDTAGGYWYFRKGEPEAVRYRLDAVEKMDKVGPSGEKRADYQAMGWSYVLTHGRYYHIFRSDNPMSEELHTDKAVKSYSFRRLGRILLCSNVLALLVIGKALFRDKGLDLFRYPVLSLMNPDQDYWFWLIALFLWLYSMVLEYRGFRRIRRRMAEDAVEKPSLKFIPVWKKHWKGYCLLGLLLLSWAAGYLFWPQTKALSEEAGIKRLPVLEELNLGGVGALAGKEEENVYISYRNLLMEDKYEIREKQTITGAGHNSDVSLTVYYYEPRSSFLVKPLYHDLVKRYIGTKADVTGSTAGTLAGAGFDDCAFAVKKDRQVLAAREGSRIVVLEYEGPGKLKDQTGILLELIKAGE